MKSKKERTIAVLINNKDFKSQKPFANCYLLFSSARVFLDIGFGVFFYFLVSETFDKS